MTNQSFEDAMHNKFRLLLLIVEEIGRAGKAPIARGIVRTVIGRSRRFGAPSRATCGQFMSRRKRDDQIAMKERSPTRRHD